MNLLLAIVALFIVSSSNLSALEFSALQKPAAAALAAATPANTPKAPPPDRIFTSGAMQSSYLQTDNCWTRDTDPEADKLGLPAQFCLSRICIEVPLKNRDIFDARASILAEGRDGLKKIFITGYTKTGEDRTVIGSLFSGKGSAGRAFAAIYFVSSLDGTVRSGLPEIRGFIIGSASVAREITYRTEAK